MRETTSKVSLYFHTHSDPCMFVPTALPHNETLKVFWGVCIPLLNCPLMPLACLLIRFLFTFLLFSMLMLHLMCSRQYFLHFVGWHLLLLVTFATQKIFNCMQSHLSILGNVSCATKALLVDVLPVPLSCVFLQQFHRSP